VFKGGIIVVAVLIQSGRIQEGINSLRRSIGALQKLKGE